VNLLAAQISDRQASYHVLHERAPVHIGELGSSDLAEALMTDQDLVTNDKQATNVVGD
jgi:hypothetical protein